MKMRLVLEQFVNPDNAPAWLQAQIQYRFGKNPQGAVVPIAYVPVGTMFEGEEFLFLCKTGQASPADDECAAGIGLNPDQIAARQIEYKMNTLGINNEDDRKLYRAGVILGYDEKLKPIPGPNWEAYQAAKADKEEEEI